MEGLNDYEQRIFYKGWFDGLFVGTAVGCSLTLIAFYLAVHL